MVSVRCQAGAQSIDLFKLSQFSVIIAWTVDMYSAIVSGTHDEYILKLSRLSVDNCLDGVLCAHGSLATLARSRPADREHQISLRSNSPSVLNASAPSREWLRRDVKFACGRLQCWREPQGSRSRHWMKRVLKCTDNI
jgi:hypothetical protein